MCVCVVRYFVCCPLSQVDCLFFGLCGFVAVHKWPLHALPSSVHRVFVVVVRTGSSLAELVRN
jgi:hypothetical protein